MLIPRRVKHRKQHHPGRTGQATGGTVVSFGEYGIQAITPAYVTNRQIEAARIDDPSYQAWWEGVDQHLPRPPTHQEAS